MQGELKRAAAPLLDELIGLACGNDRFDAPLYATGRVKRPRSAACAPSRPETPPDPFRVLTDRPAAGSGSQLARVGTASYETAPLR